MAQTKIKRKQFSDDGWIPANETWTYASADDPTYTFTISAFDATAKYTPGMKIKLTQSTGGTKFAFITKVVFDDPGSTITAYFGTDYNLENEAITAPYYSMLKAPFGFPLSPLKWIEEFRDANSRVQTTPTLGTWYNIATSLLSIPIGSWLIKYKVDARPQDSVSGAWDQYVTLSTANNSESDVDFTTRIAISSQQFLEVSLCIENHIDIATKTTYYLNTKTTQNSLDNLYYRGDTSPTTIRAICAYL